MASSGSFESSSYEKSGGYYGELRVSWTSSKTTAGKTTVNWELRAVGRETQTNTQLVTTATVSINNKTEWSINNDYLSYNNNFLDEGSFEIDHDAQGNGGFSISITYQKKYYYFNQAETYSQQFYLDKNVPYTACYWGNGAAVWIDESIQAPGQEITISWNKAMSGTSNPIDGFKIYYKLNSGTWQSAGSDVSASATSAKMTVPDNRGATITAKVEIKNRQSGFDNPTLTGGGCKINRLPEKPSVPQIIEEHTIINNTIMVPSTQETISFRVEAGEDSEEDYPEVHFSRDSDGAKTLYITGEGLTINENENENTNKSEFNFYFWTWDGLEYSNDCTTITIIKNTKPEINTITINEDKDKDFNQTISVEAGGSQEGRDQYLYGFQYNGRNYWVTTTTNNQYNIGDVRKYLYDKIGAFDQNTTYGFKYYVQRYDGVEYSNIIYSTRDYKFTTPTLTISALTEKNQEINEPTGYFYNKIKVEPSQKTNYYYASDAIGTYNDTEIPRGSAITEVSFRRDADSQQYFRIKLPRGQQLTKTLPYEFKNVVTPLDFKPYKESSTTFTMFGYDEQYGFSGAPVIQVGDHRVEGKKIGDTWEYKLTPDQLWGEKGIATNVVNNSTATAKIESTITNDFGETVSTDLSFGFDFRTPPSINNFSVCDSENQNSVSIKQGTPLTLNGTIYYYGKNLEIDIVDVSAKEKRYALSLKNEGPNIKPWGENGAGGWVATPYIYTLSEVTTEKQPEVNLSYETNFEITANSNGNKASWATKSVKVLRHTPARLRFTELQYSNNTLSGSFKIEDFGYDTGTGGYVSAVYLEGSEIYSEDITTNEEISFAIENYDFGEANFKNLAPVCKTIFDLNGAETAKETSDLEYLIVYNILPTVAYRQNYVGINTKKPEKDGGADTVLTVSAYNEKDKIYLISAERNPPSIVDLSTGALINFFVDCGSWDGTSGGIIPGDPNVPEGLATIAYTGEIGDLEQKRTDIIIISGGSSTEQI